MFRPEEGSAGPGPKRLRRLTASAPEGAPYQTSPSNLLLVLIPMSPSKMLSAGRAHRWRGVPWRLA
jgi:hypothetical protein